MNFSCGFCGFRCLCDNDFAAQNHPQFPKKGMVNFMVHGIKTDIISGFLGAGKTTLIKKLIKEAYAGEKVVLIENEFGEIGIDSGFLADAGVTVNEMNSGCICCSLVGDFGKALSQVIEDYSPERIIIEPSGVGKLSDIIRAVEGLHDERLLLNSYAAVVDAKKCRMYMKNFGEFFNDQIESAGAIIFSHTAGLSQKKIDEAVALVREHNPTAVMVATDWELLSGKDIVAAMERRDTLDADVKALEDETVCPECGHHHGHDHHHHDHDEECCCHEHEHHHHHGECDDPDCHCHEHEHHHHADDVFTSWGVETARKYTPDEIRAALEALDESSYGTVLRAKGIVAATNGDWIHFDYVPGESDVRAGAADITGRLCVIGTGLNQSALAALFGIAAE